MLKRQKEDNMDLRLCGHCIRPVLFPYAQHITLVCGGGGGIRRERIWTHQIWHTYLYAQFLYFRFFSFTSSVQHKFPVPVLHLYTHIIYIPRQQHLAPSAEWKF